MGRAHLSIRCRAVRCTLGIIGAGWYDGRAKMAQRNRGEERLREWRQQLIEAAAETGGWPYYQGHNPRLEPTCWALLALDDPASDERALIGRSWSFLRRLQRKDGLLVEPDAPGPNYAWNGLALLAGTRQSDSADTPDW